MPTRVHVEGVGVVNFPDGMTPEQITAEVSKLAPQAPQQASPEAPAGGMLPTAGAFGGSLLGTLGGIPGRIAGAGVGGALGKGAELYLDEKDDSLTDSLKAMVAEGGKQAAFEAAGGAIGKGLKAVAPKIADVALAPIESLARKHPNLGAVYVREGKLFSGLRGGVGAIGKKSSADQAAALRSASRQASDDMLRAADAAGAPPIQTQRAMRGAFRPMLTEAATDVAAGKPDIRPQVVERVRRLTTRSPRLSLSEANVMRRRLDDTAEKAFEAARKGQAINVTEASMDKAIAGGLRQRIREGAEAAGQTGYAAATTRTRELAGLTKALEKASTRKHLLTRNLGLTSGAVGVGTGILSGDPGAGIGAGLGALGTYYAVTNPRNLGRLALGAHGFGTVAMNTPEGVRLWMLLNALAEPQPDPAAPPQQ